MTHPAGGRLHTVSTVVKMVCPCRRGNLRAFLTAGALSIVGYVKDGTHQKCFIAMPSRCPKLSPGSM
jgi:hypothetical protein